MRKNQENPFKVWSNSDADTWNQNKDQKPNRNIIKFSQKGFKVRRKIFGFKSESSHYDANIRMKRVNI